MSDALDAAVAKLTEKFSGADFDGSVKFDIEDEGVVRVADGAVTKEDGDADVTILASMETLQEIFQGDLSPTAAYMSGRLKIDGDMSQAMKLTQFLG